jgi:hypothetical protein
MFVSPTNRNNNLTYQDQIDLKSQERRRLMAHISKRAGDDDVVGSKARLSPPRRNNPQPERSRDDQDNTDESTTSTIISLTRIREIGNDFPIQTICRTLGRCHTNIMLLALSSRLGTWRRRERRSIISTCQRDDFHLMTVMAVRLVRVETSAIQEPQQYVDKSMTTQRGERDNTRLNG